MIKPIETEYNGYRFRSRLEARWAVYFDALGIKYEYEPEGFEVLPGIWYLPDFYFPEWDCFAEVKYSEFTRLEFEKCLGLPKPCILLDESPNAFRGYYATGTGAIDPDNYTVYLSGEAFGYVSIQQSHYKGRLWFYFGESPNSYTVNYDAEVAAKSARFEHGEVP